MEARLSGVSVGGKGLVCSIKAGAGLKKRFLSMGIIPGTAVEVVRVAPFGDPVEVKVRGYSLSLRKEEAECIYIKE